MSGMGNVFGCLDKPFTQYDIPCAECMFLYF